LKGKLGLISKVYIAGIKVQKNYLPTELQRSVKSKKRNVKKLRKFWPKERLKRQ
jgi:hypothetical protein